MEYKKKVERQLENNNTKEVWRGMRTITGYRLKNSQSLFIPENASPLL